jgi:GLPGLI family protein
MKITPKNLVLYSILLSSCFVTNAQDNKTLFKINYEYQNDFFSHIETLVTDGEKAVYVRPSLNVKKNDVRITQKDDNYIIPLSEIKTSAISIFSSKTINNIYEFTVNIENERYIVNDSTYLIKWKIDKTEIKSIGKFDCYKATTKFRGRNYTAYFTPEMQINFGPFKFNNLPGLIIQISNQENDINHSWVLKSIDNVEEGYKMPNISDLKATRINLFQLRQMNLELQEAKSKRFSSRMPSGVTRVKTEVKNLGIETVYEWETEDEEKK